MRGRGEKEMRGEGEGNKEIGKRRDRFITSYHTTHEALAIKQQ